jgi:pyruvate formate lyase activating enzyme
LIGLGKPGICKVRSFIENEDGPSPWYGRVSALAMDPIEKKPLKHFHPGQMILSVGFYGCNARCPFCQNWDISQEFNVDSGHILLPSELVSIAKHQHSFAVAFTYSEPLIHFEYLKDAMTACREEGLYTVLVSNGNILEGPAREIFPLVDACNIDFKTWSDKDAGTVLGVDLSSVKKTIEIACETGVHVETSTLVVPGINDDMDELLHIAEWIARLDSKIPWHIAACHPAWHYNGPPSDPVFICALQSKAANILDFVYTGNI